MKRRLIWSAKAQGDLDEIVENLTLNKPDFAHIFAAYAAKIAENLTINPIGRTGELAGAAERVLSRYPTHMLIFTADDSTVHILRVFPSTAPGRL